MKNPIKNGSDSEERKKTLFLANISHELRTPLATMSGFCEMLAEPDVPQETGRRYLDAIRNAIASMRTVIDEIDDLARLDAGTLPLRKNKVEAVKICTEQTLLLQRTADEKNVSLICCPAHLPHLEGDPERLATIVHSILEYAVENACGGDTIELRIQYRPQKDGDGILVLELSGRDVVNFDCTVYSGNADDCPLRNGSNVHLHLAAQALKAMQGTMFEDRAEQTLTLEIPMRPLTVPQEPVKPSAEQHTLEAAADGPKTCLLVDDVPMNLKVLAALMRKMNCMPLLATSGQEALQLLARNRVNLVMTDLWMPEMNGMELAMTIRQMPEYNCIPILAVTADVERAENFDMQYFADTLIKPVNLAMLKTTLTLMHLIENKL